MCQIGRTNPISICRCMSYAFAISVQLRDPVALASVLRTLDVHSDPACLAPPKYGSARQIFRNQYCTYPWVQHSTYGCCSCAQPLPRAPPELERARNWPRPRSVRSAWHPPQLMVPFAAPLAGFSARSRDRALLGLRSVLERIPARTSLAGGGFRTATERAIAAIGSDLFIRGHSDNHDRQPSVGLREELALPAALLHFRLSISSLRFSDFELPLSFFGSAFALYAAGLRPGAGAPWRYLSDAVQIWLSSQVGLHLNFSWFNRGSHSGPNCACLPFEFILRVRWTSLPQPTFDSLVPSHWERSKMTFCQLRQSMD